MESYPSQAVLPLVGLAADKVIPDRYYFRRLDLSEWKAAPRKPSSRWSDSRRIKSSATRHFFRHTNWTHVTRTFNCGRHHGGVGRWPGHDLGGRQQDAARP
ncbi:MAG: hypothetical protein ACQESR_24185 [Planctomycetota bacterium]